MTFLKFSLEAYMPPSTVGGSCGHMWLKLYAGTEIKQPVSTKTFHWVFYFFWREPKYQHAAESENDNCVRCIFAFPRILQVAPVVIHG